MSRYKLAIVCSLAVGILCSVGVSFIWRGDFVANMVVTMLAAVVGAPLLLIAFCSWLLAIRRRRTYLWTISVASLSLGAVAVLVILSLPLGSLIQKGDIEQAQKYCNDLVPLLDSYKDSTGAYPQRIDAIRKSSDRLPHLLKYGVPYFAASFYKSEGDSFVFRFEVRDGLLPTVYAYSSKSRVWREYS